MIRVALVITGLDVGGAERQLVNLATGLDPRFFKPRVFVLRPRPVEGRDSLVQRLREVEIPIEYFGIERWWQFWPALPQLIERMRAFGPQVMQSFLVHANILGAEAAQAAGVRGISLGMRVADRRWRYRWVYRRWERAAARGAQRVVSVSQQVADFARQELRLKDEQSLVIRNGIDVDMFAGVAPADLAPFGLAPGERPVVFVGRLDPQKGADRLVELAPMLAALGVPLLIVGSGPLERALRAALGKQPRVHFAGWQANIAGILRASRLLVLPSRFEGMPNVVLEAMAAGRPALVTPVEGAEELLGDLAFGQMLRWDRSLWSGGLGRLLTNEQLAVETGQQNQARIREHFSQTSMVEKYARLFSELASRSPLARRAGQFR